MDFTDGKKMSLFSVLYLIKMLLIPQNKYAIAKSSVENYGLLDFFGPKGT